MAGGPPAGCKDRCSSVDRQVRGVREGCTRAGYTPALGTSSVGTLYTVIY